MSRNIEFGSDTKVSKREIIAISYLLVVLLAFFYMIYSVKAEHSQDSTLWQLVAGFFFGNVLGFYVTIAKYRINIFFRPEELSDYFNLLVIVVFSIAGIWIGLYLVSGNGHQAAVMGAVAAAVIFIPATFESWLDAKQEQDCIVAIRLEIEKAKDSAD
ncbi:hypothetical protein [Marinobacter sp.]|uniref:hypothetical protein n=1 Tax=Marinobacter sp. TaxID=50741 RepID=UPI003F96A4CB